MEREKMIEEQSKEIASIIEKGFKEWLASRKTLRGFYEDTSYEILDKNYRKVPEGAVVLTKDELAKHDEKVSKEAAMEVLKKVDYESNRQTIMVTNYIRKKYSVEVKG